MEIEKSDCADSSTRYAYKCRRRKSKAEMYSCAPKCRGHGIRYVEGNLYACSTKKLAAFGKAYYKELQRSAEAEKTSRGNERQAYQR